MASLEKSMIDKTLGEVDNNVKTQVINTIQTFLS